MVKTSDREISKLRVCLNAEKGWLQPAADEPLMTQMEFPSTVSAELFLTEYRIAVVLESATRAWRLLRNLEPLRTRPADEDPGVINIVYESLAPIARDLALSSEAVLNLVSVAILNPSETRHRAHYVEHYKRLLKLTTLLQDRKNSNLVAFIRGRLSRETAAASTSDAASAMMTTTPTSTFDGDDDANHYGQVYPGFHSFANSDLVRKQQQEEQQREQELRHVQSLDATHRKMHVEHAVALGLHTVAFVASVFAKEVRGLISFAESMHQYDRALNGYN